MYFKKEVPKINKTTYKQMIKLERLKEACRKKWKKKCETMGGCKKWQ